MREVLSGAELCRLVGVSGPGEKRDGTWGVGQEPLKKAFQGSSSPQAEFLGRVLGRVGVGWCVVGAPEKVDFFFEREEESL